MLQHPTALPTYPELANKRVLIVEDEPVIAVDYRFHLLEVGACPVKFPPSNSTAVACLRLRQVDTAIVDYRLLDGTSEPVMRWLRDHGIPFIVVSAWSQKVAPDSGASHILAKPVNRNDLWRALSDAVQRRVQ